MSCWQRRIFSNRVSTPGARQNLAPTLWVLWTSYQGSVLSLCRGIREDRDTLSRTHASLVLLLWEGRQPGVHDQLDILAQSESNTSTRSSAPLRPTTPGWSALLAGSAYFSCRPQGRDGGQPTNQTSVCRQRAYCPSVQHTMPPHRLLEWWAMVDSRRSNPRQQGPR